MKELTVPKLSEGMRWAAVFIGNGNLLSSHMQCMRCGHVVEKERINDECPCYCPLPSREKTNDPD